MAGSPLSPGNQRQLLAGAPTAAGSVSTVFSTEADTVLLMLRVTAASGSVTVTARAWVNEQPGETLVTYPTVTAPTGTFLLRRAPITSQQVQVTVTYTDACAYELHGRAIYSGLTDARILGAGSMRVSQVTVPTTPTVLVPASLTDRAGIIVKSWSTSGDLFIATDIPSTTTLTGYPLAPRDSLSIDLSAGVVLYGVASAGTIDCRTAEVGN